MSQIRETVEAQLNEAFANAGVDAPEAYADDMVLLQTGLDSLGFAILVAQLENELGYDPFTMMDEAVYPTTLGEFVEIYEKYAPKGQA